MNVSAGGRRSEAVRSLPVAVGVFARAPVPGETKTRLMPLLGARGAADFQRALIADATRKLRALHNIARPHFFLTGGVRGSPPVPESSTITLRRQRGANLGVRLERAFRFLLRDHAIAVIFGTDSPLLPPRILRLAIDKLRTSDAVLGPCPDGGYYLIGLRRSNVLRPLTEFRAKPFPALQPKHGEGLYRHERSGKSPLTAVFRSVRWSTRFAFRDTLRNLLQLGFSCWVLDPVADVDRPQDLGVLYETMSASAAARRMAFNTWRFLGRL